jgi:hypothetical protein
MRLPSRADLLREPWVVLAPLVVAQWAAVAVFAQIVRHNGWLFYQGGDQTFFYTSSWVLAGGHIPESNIGYGWSYLLAPISLVSGANVVAALPWMILFQVGVLLPVALLAVYGIAARLGGRLIGYFAAVLWIGGPYITIPLWDQRYHAKYVEQFLPQALGLTGLGDFPSMVFLLVAAYFTVRALDTRAPVDAVLAGVTAGFAIGIKPANLLFIGGPLVGFTLARRWREGLSFALALAPALLALALWKYRGLGNQPFITPAPKAYAAGAVLGGDPPSTLGFLSRYLNFDWWQLRNNNANLREFFWSPRALEWVGVAGLIGAARRSVPKAGMLGAWLGAFILVKGTSPAASLEEGTFLRLFLPGFPPFLLLASAIPLLAPRAGPRIPVRFPAPTFALHWRSPPAVAAIAVLAAIPLLLFLVLQPLKSPTAPKYFENGVIVPVDNGFQAHATRAQLGILVAWKPPRGNAAEVFYRVFRSRAVKGAPDPTYPPGREGIRCLGPGFGGAADCRIEMEVIATTRGRSFLDRSGVPRGRWTYRVGLAANWRDDTEAGDVLLLSGPGNVTGP